MSKRVMLIVAVVAVLAIGIVSVTNSEGFWHHPDKIPIHWKVAGSNAYVLVFNPADENYPPTPVPGLIIDIVTMGIPFGARSKVIGIADGVAPSNGDCEESLKLLFQFDDMIVTFPDLSMIFATMDDEMPPGFHCFMDPFPQRAVAHMKIIGGTGKFEGASGKYTGTFTGQPVGESGSLWAETGTIEGWIDR